MSDKSSSRYAVVDAAVAEYLQSREGQLCSMHSLALGAAVHALKAVDAAIDPVRLQIFLAALPFNLARAGGLEPGEDARRTRAIEDSIRCADEAIEKLIGPSGMEKKP